MTINQLKKSVKDMTGFKKVWIRKGTGSMAGMINIMSSINDSNSFKPFEKELKEKFKVAIFSNYTVSIRGFINV